jgi:hypothetical protein
MIRARSLGALLLFGAVLRAPAAHADPSPADIATARQAFESAVALEAEQKWVEATQKLRQALAIKDTPGLRFHLAHCEERQGQLVEAALDYDRASELLRQGAKAPDVQKLLAPASADLKRRIPRVTVEIPSDAANPVAQLDGKAFAPSELLLGQPLNPGSHQLKVSANGKSPFDREFSLNESDQISIRVELKNNQVAPALPSATPVPPSAPASASPPVDSVQPAAAPRKPSAKVYLLLGESAVTVAGLALGVGYALAESSARNRVQAAQSQIDQTAKGDGGACNTPGPLSGTCAELRTAIDDHDRDATVSTVGFVCAGVGAAALLTTWLAYPNPRADSARPAVQPIIAFGHIGVRGQF